MRPPLSTSIKQSDSALGPRWKAVRGDLGAIGGPDGVRDEAHGCEESLPISAVSVHDEQAQPKMLAKPVNAIRDQSGDQAESESTRAGAI